MFGLANKLMSWVFPFEKKYCLVIINLFDA